MKKKINRLMIILVAAITGYAPEIFGSMPELGTPVWIDTDPACGLNATDDVDDCWALLAAFKSPEIVVRGISTVFGNVDCDTALLFMSGRKSDLNIRGAFLHMVADAGVSERMNE